ncbi:hypothetical protein LguiA_026781 [Lonicera macranthoides]
MEENDVKAGELDGPKSDGELLGPNVGTGEENGFIDEGVVEFKIEGDNVKAGELDGPKSVIDEEEGFIDEGVEKLKIEGDDVKAGELDGPKGNEELLGPNARAKEFVEDDVPKGEELNAVVDTSVTGKLKAGVRVEEVKVFVGE